MPKDLWTHKGSKFVIGTLHGDKIEITAQYNPKELARQAAASWTVHPNTSARKSKTSQNHLWMEFGNTEPRTLTLELLFDGYEEGQSIAASVDLLEGLTMPVDMGSKRASERRPQVCVAVWGNQNMRCVVTSVATKLSMFDSMGEPLRANCTVTLKEVDVVAMLAADREHFDVDAAQRGYLADSRTSRQLPYPPEDSKPTRVPPYRSESTPPAAANRAPAAAKPAPANTVGAPSAKINPAALDGAQPGTGPLFADEAPAAAPAPAQAPANTVGTPSAQVDPNAMDGEGDHVFVGEQPAPKTTGTPSDQINPAALDGTQPGTGPLYKSEDPQPDAVSSADSGTTDPKIKAAYEDLE